MDLIPGETSPYSKSMDLFPANAPRYILSAKGCILHSTDGREFIDWGMNVRSVILGYAFREIDDNVIDAVRRGIGYTRPSIHEAALAELMCDIIPSAEMVKFGKSGSDATSAAVKLARAYTGRELVLVAKENPFISQHDWFIGKTPVYDGIITSDEYGTLIANEYSYDNLFVKDYPKSFHFDISHIFAKPYENIEKSTSDDITELEFHCANRYNKPAAIILDPSTVDITKEKLQYIRDICNKYGVVMIMDEIISGFRYGTKGVQGMFGITPDLSTFGKSMGNGYSISALCGKREIMELGDRDKGNVFLLSGTYFGETTGLAAATATINYLQKHPVTEYIKSIGSILCAKLKDTIAYHDMGDFVSVNDTFPQNPSIVWKDIKLKTLFDQFMVERGILMPYIAPSYSHTPEHIANTACAADYALGRLRAYTSLGIDDKRISEALMNGHCEKPVFRRTVANDSRRT